MTQALTPALQVLAGAVVRKTRELPVPGRILCRQGDSVTPDAIVGRAELPGDLHILRIPETLGIEPFEAVKGLKVDEGGVIAEGDLVCEHVGLFGLFRSRYHSPVDGAVEFVSRRTGHLGVRLAPHAIELRAYVQGTVADVDPGKSVTIESRGAFIQGIFGVGGERYGTIRMLDGGPKTIVGPKKIPADAAGQVLVGGTRPTLEALQRAAETGAAGLVVGSIDDYALTGYLGYDLGMAVTGHEDVPLTVIVTEGFGWLPVAERTHSLLRSLGRPRRLHQRRHPGAGGRGAPGNHRGPGGDRLRNRGTRPGSRPPARSIGPHHPGTPLRRHRGSGRTARGSPAHRNRRPHPRPERPARQRRRRHRPPGQRRTAVILQWPLTVRIL